MIDTMEFENLNFGCVWTCLAWVRGNGAKNVGFMHQNTQKCNGLERNRMVLKEPYMSLTLTVLPVYLIKPGENGLERNSRSPPFAV